MTEPDLHQALLDVPIAAPTRDLGGLAWQRAVRAHHRRRRLATWGVVVLIAGSASVLATRRDGSHDRAPVGPASSARPTVSPAPTGAVGKALVWLMPRVADEATLPQGSSRLPSTITIPRADAPQLAAAPVKRFIAAGARRESNSFVVDVLGDDGAWRQVTADLAAVADRDGHQTSIVSPAAISPDGRTVAVTQPGAVLLVSSTGATRRLTVGGPYNESLSWLPDGSIRVRSGSGASDVDPDSGVVSPVTADSPDQGADLILTGNHQPVFRRASTAGSTHDTDVLLPVYEFLGSTAVGARDIARAMATTEFVVPGGEIANPEAIAVVDLDTGATRAVLVAGDISSRGKICCRAVSWLSDTVLAYQAGRRVLAWDTTTGAISLLSTIPAQVTAIAP